MTIILKSGTGPIMLPGGRFLIANRGTGTLSMQFNDFKVGNNLAKFYIQRKAGSHSASDPGYADVVFPFTFSGTAPLAVDVRVVDADTPAIVVKDWTPLIGIVIDSATTGYGTARIPAGGDYLTDMRDGNNTTTVVAQRSKQRWGIGVGILGEGQSNMVQTLAAGSFADAVPGMANTSEEQYLVAPSSAGAVFGTDHGFVAVTNLPGYVAGDSNSTGSGSGPNNGGVESLVRIVAAALKQQYAGKKIPVFLIAWTQGSTSLNAWISGGDLYEGLFNGTGARAGTANFKSAKNVCAGDFEIVAVNQGETEQDTTYAGRMAQLKAYCQLRYDYVKNNFNRGPDQLSILIAPLGAYNTGATVSQADTFRKVVFDLESAAPGLGWTKLRVGWSTIDQMPPPDNALHLVGESQIVSQRRLCQSIIHEVAPSVATSKGQGPRIASVVRGAGMTATVTLTHDGGSDITGSGGGAALTGFSAHTDASFDNAKGAPVTVSAARAGTNTITLTCSQFPCYVHFGRGMTPDTSNWPLDNVQYPSACIGTDLRTGQPVLPTSAPYLVN